MSIYGLLVKKCRKYQQQSVGRCLQCNFSVHNKKNFIGVVFNEFIKSL